jgi:uncharacterized membrane protein YbaN (DUF454 family)
MRWLWVKKNWKRLPHPFRWVIAASVGSTLVVLGLTGLVLPVIPGIPLLIAGFALLASEFTWAEVLLNKTKNRVTKAVNKVRKKK